MAAHAVNMARQQGLKVGMLHLTTLWPFNDKLLLDVAENTDAIIVAELNLGQIVHEVERASRMKVPVHLVGHAGGTIIEPETLLAKIVEVAK